MNIWINSNNKLNLLCDQLTNCRLIALDTEFIRTDTYYPKIALIQLSDGENIWLIDVLAIDDFSPLKKLLESPETTLIFHACAEDLEVLDHSINVQPTEIFDTQIAAGIVNIGYCMGYARLVDSVLGIQLDKQETRSNWLARPLSERQIDYAAVDVLYLHSLHSILLKMLDEQNRFEWFKEETQELFKIVDQRKNNHDYYTRIRGAWRLNTQSLTALRHLCLWRDRIAREKDIPKARIVKDVVLLEIANQMPKYRHQLHSISGFHSRAIKRYGDLILKEVNRSINAEPVVRLSKPLSSGSLKIVKNIKNSLATVAEEIKIPQEFLSNKRELEGIISSGSEGNYQLPARFEQGWRQKWVMPVLESELEEAKLNCDSL